MPIEAVMYLCMGILTMLGFLLLEWFSSDELTSSGVGIGLVMVIFWPVGIICLVGVGISMLFSEDIVLLRRKK